jgi:hypothetical protein
VATDKVKRGGPNGSKTSAPTPRPQITGAPPGDAWDPDSFGGRH